MGRDVPACEAHVQEWLVTLDKGPDGAAMYRVTHTSLRGASCLIADRNDVTGHINACDEAVYARTGGVMYSVVTWDLQEPEGWREAV